MEEEVKVSLDNLKDFKKELDKNLLFKDNTDEYTPTLEYHPATKGYVDSSVEEAVKTEVFAFDGQVNAANKAMFKEVGWKLGYDEPAVITYRNSPSIWNGVALVNNKIVLTCYFLNFPDYDYKITDGQIDNSNTDKVKKGVTYNRWVLSRIEYREATNELIVEDSYKELDIPRDINWLGLDNTTEFTPTGDYNPATKKYIDDLVSSLATKTELEQALQAISSFSWKEVDSLESIEEPKSNIIYLVKREASPAWTVGTPGNVGETTTPDTSETTNEPVDVHDEYIYVNGKFEFIGTLQVDLSDYYTKEETNTYVTNAIKNIDGMNIKTITGNTYGDNLDSGIYYCTKDLNLMYTDTEGGIWVRNLKEGATILVQRPQCFIFEPYKNEIVRGTYGSFDAKSFDKILTTDNAKSFTPTGDYNPATKKYVDDAIANINSSNGNELSEIPGYSVVANTSLSDGKPTSYIKYSLAPNKNELVRRDAGGSMQANAGTAAKSVVNLEQMNTTLDDYMKVYRIVVQSESDLTIDNTSLTSALKKMIIDLRSGRFSGISISVINEGKPDLSRFCGIYTLDTGDIYNSSLRDDVEIKIKTPVSYSIAQNIDGTSFTEFQAVISFKINNNEISELTPDTEWIVESKFSFLATDAPNNNTNVQYIPTYNNHPTNKYYVDNEIKKLADRIAALESGSSN